LLRTTLNLKFPGEFAGSNCAVIARSIEGVESDVAISEKTFTAKNAKLRKGNSRQDLQDQQDFEIRGQRSVGCVK
jgi:hypothetical protein